MGSQKKDLSRQDWALLVIAAAKGETLTPVQLQKCLFLLGQEKSDVIGSDYYDFVAYDYGPFSSDIYRDAEQLENDGSVIIKYAPHGRWKEYLATPSGMQCADALRQSIDPEVTSFIDECVKWARNLSFRALVKAIYQQYPEYRANSVFRD